VKPAAIGLARRARYLACVAAVGALVAGTVLSAHPQAAQAASACQVAYTVNSDWGTGFSTSITITNTGSAISS
jgi:endoglucanase